jgi:hypothetical protein
MPVGLFGSKENARNYENWQYSPAAGPLPNTKRLIAAAIDVRPFTPPHPPTHPNPDPDRNWRTLPLP